MTLNIIGVVLATIVTALVFDAFTALAIAFVSWSVHLDEAAWFFVRVFTLSSAVLGFVTSITEAK